MRVKRKAQGTSTCEFVGGAVKDWSARMGPKMLCCGKPYTRCECPVEVAEISDEGYELPPQIVMAKKMPPPPPRFYPGSPAAWRPIINTRWGGFNIYHGSE